MELEDKLKELERTADKLDEKDVSLEEAIRLFENGVVLIRDCLEKLNESKGKIEAVSGKLNEILENCEDETN